MCDHLNPLHLIIQLTVVKKLHCSALILEQGDIERLEKNGQLSQDMKIN